MVFQFFGLLIGIVCFSLVQTGCKRKMAPSVRPMKRSRSPVSGKKEKNGSREEVGFSKRRRARNGKFQIFSKCVQPKSGQKGSERANEEKVEVEKTAMEGEKEQSEGKKAEMPKDTETVQKAGGDKKRELKADEHLR